MNFDPQHPSRLDTSLDGALACGLTMLAKEMKGFNSFSEKLGLNDNIIYLSLLAITKNASLSFIQKLDIHTSVPELIQLRRIYFLAILELNFCMQNSLGFLSMKSAATPTAFFQHAKSLTLVGCIEQIKQTFLHSSQNPIILEEQLEQLLRPIYTQLYNQNCRTPIANALPVPVYNPYQTYHPGFYSSPVLQPQVGYSSYDYTF